MLQRLLKRQIDFWISLFSLAVLSPGFLIVAILIKLDSKGPVFFRQERVGKEGRVFKIFKFRTMVDGAVNIGLSHNVAKGDTRITKVGNLLRNWGLDELPQLINVLKGEMSIVGPRATLKYQVEQYDDFQRKRLAVKPGITGWALVNGRNNLTWEERIKLDIWYIENWSLWLDVKIIFKTFIVVLITREGVYSANGVNYDFNPGEHIIELIDTEKNKAKYANPTKKP